MNIGALIPFLPENKENIKMHCAIGSVVKLTPLYEFSKGKFKEWQDSQNKKNFERDYILSLIYYKKNEWLFAGIYKSIDVKETKNGTFVYKTELLHICEDIIGRLIISFEKDFRASYLKLENFIDDLDICEITRRQYKIDPFPGFNNVFVPFDLLKIIIEEQENSWKSILSNVKGVYLITDRSNGKLYVGSASGEDAIWQRWNNYIENGHGNNKALKEIIQKNKYEYTFNYSFSILEIFGLNASDNEILKKESFWKEKLMTREYGYNEN
jgi:hypothetical protein